MIKDAFLTRFARRVLSFDISAIPEPVVDKAKLLLLDTLGLRVGLIDFVHSHNDRDISCTRVIDSFAPGTNAREGSMTLPLNSAAVLDCAHKNPAEIAHRQAIFMGPREEAF